MPEQPARRREEDSDQQISQLQHFIIKEKYYENHRQYCTGRLQCRN